MNTDQKLHQPIAALAFMIALILLIPLLAMQFTNEVHWTLSDFIFAGGLLFGTGLMYILATRMTVNTAYRVAVGFALFTGLFLIWTNAAVGIIGSEDTPFNVMYFGVIAVGIIGGFFVRFRPHGMVRTMFAMVLAQGVITAIALAGGFYQFPTSTVFHIIGVNGFFITLLVVSALLFRYAEQDQTAPNENISVR